MSSDAGGRPEVKGMTGHPPAVCSRVWPRRREKNDDRRCSQTEWWNSTGICHVTHAYAHCTHTYQRRPCIKDNLEAKNGSEVDVLQLFAAAEDDVATFHRRCADIFTTRPTVDRRSMCALSRPHGRDTYKTRCSVHFTEWDKNRIVSLNLCKECLNVATFKIPVLLVIKSRTFRYTGWLKKVSC